MAELDAQSYLRGRISQTPGLDCFSEFQRLRSPVRSARHKVYKAARLTCVVNMHICGLPVITQRKRHLALFGVLESIRQPVISFSSYLIATDSIALTDYT